MLIDDFDYFSAIFLQKKFYESIVFVQDFQQSLNK